MAKTRHRLTQAFFWPRLSEDVWEYCRTCPTCQKMGKTGDHPKAPLHPMPIIQEPFSRVAVDIIGPLPRPSATGKRYILTVVDYATRYPEAVALSNIQADTVADGLLQVFSRVGFPQEILSDQGSQFTAELTQQLWRLCGVKALHSAPYHPQTNGLCERFNGTLKQLIRAYAQERKDCEKYLPHLLFAYREVPQESTGFSPFELLYGRRVRGPLDLDRAQWEGGQEAEGLPAVSYVLELRERLTELTAMVQGNMQAAQAQQEAWYDRSARSRSFLMGQKVLVLKPQRQNKLQASWQGPYRVVTQVGETTYVVVSCTDTRIQRTFHVNMLKAYHERPETVSAICAPAAEEAEQFPLVDLPGIDCRPSGVEQVQLGEGLGPHKQEQARQLLQEHQELFSALPGYTSRAVHQVETPGQRPLRQPAYRLPEAVHESMRAEIREMLELGVIEPSVSPWASPVVLVPKKDGTTRFCVDYRRLNDCTVTDAYPMPRVDELLDQISQGHFLTTVDLCKGYWQIPLAEEATPKSAFITPFGLYQFRVMPFGIKNAPATFQRLIDRLLDGLQEFACAYLDDIAIYSQTWEEHLHHLGVAFARIRDANLTLKPTKCRIGMSEVQYLGHRVGRGTQRPEPAKIEAILEWPTPITKTQVLAFLGMAGYYRKFVPNYSVLAKPLTDLTKKTLPRQVLWSPECETAFQQLKTALTQAPLLAAPNYSKRFIVHTDASMFGLGAVLSQVGDDGGGGIIRWLTSAANSYPERWDTQRSRKNVWPWFGPCESSSRMCTGGPSP
uniref:Gypsy retrotransposon integrase-like protein 1 n=1 Tax=Leptobrachium leishanense TaxID=445787 RepID=A0A8C5MCT0_9ANUR